MKKKQIGLLGTPTRIPESFQSREIVHLIFFLLLQNRSYPDPEKIPSYFLFLHDLFMAGGPYSRWRTFVPIPGKRARGSEVGIVNWELNGSEVQSLSMLNNVLWRISFGLAILALGASIVLLIGNPKVGIVSRLPAAAIPAVPLLLVGAAFLIVQPVIRPRFVELLKNAILAAAFLLWGAIQFMPRNTTSLRLGNVVIVLYVLDLAWVILGSKISSKRNQNRHS